MISTSIVLSILLSCSFLAMTISGYQEKEGLASYFLGLTVLFAILLVANGFKKSKIKFFNWFEMQLGEEDQKNQK